MKTVCLQAPSLTAIGGAGARYQMKRRGTFFLVPPCSRTRGPRAGSKLIDCAPTTSDFQYIAAEFTELDLVVMHTSTTVLQST